MNSFALYRHKAGYSQVDAAIALGVDRSTVAKWETEKSLPRGGVLKQIAKLYHCSVAQLLDEDDGGVDAAATATNEAAAMTAGAR